jgi:hypothetical protein
LVQYLVSSAGALLYCQCRELQDSPSFTPECYSAGSSSLQNVLDAQRYLYSAREADAQSALSLVSAYTALCKSLDGARQREG